MVVQVTSDAGSRVSGAIEKAARATGTSFDYLLKTALRESNFEPNAKAPTSSATGLFQFIDQTWLATLKQAGPSLGYGDYASAIVQSSGHYSVPDPNMRRAIMNLRLDPTANAAMAGALTQANAAQLSAGIGRKPTDGELYMAHFLGASGALKLIGAAATTPQAIAANLLPEAAQANRSIFYTAQGTARSASQVYVMLTSQQNVAVPAAAAALSAAPASTFAAQDPQSNGAASQPAPPLFQSLFQDKGRGAVSPIASQLWSSPTAPRAEPNAGGGGRAANLTPEPIPVSSSRRIGHRIRRLTTAPLLRQCPPSVMVNALLSHTRIVCITLTTQIRGEAPWIGSCCHDRSPFPSVGADGSRRRQGRSDERLGSSLSVF